MTRPRLMVVLILLLSPLLLAADEIEFAQEKLDNGMNVIYAPLRQAPVVHVRVLYFVGSRDEKPDRQGFAHMFEHMMFRGSAHVKPEEHMKLIGMVGGNSNAFTSFDQTTYVNTIPSEHLEMALYLEADRMASFKVSPEIYKVERNVVAKEWGMRQNQPYGSMYEDFLKLAVTKHHYRWTPIGVMEHLRAAPVSDLQEFFNTYYVPNNATLIIAGDIDVARTKELVKKYYAWIPKGAEISRVSPQEPEQTEARRQEVKKAVPLPTILSAYRIPGYASDDLHALGLLGSILGEGRSSRLDRQFVNSAQPVAVSVSAGPWALVDSGLFMINARLLPGKNVAEVEKALADAIAEVIEKGVTAEELDKAKTQARIDLIRGRETAVQIATQLGEALVFGGDANRVNTELDRLMKVTPAEIQAVAKKYLLPHRCSTLIYVPDPAARTPAAATVAQLEAAEVVVATKDVPPRPVKFPDNYPASAPMAKPGAGVEFAKGTELEVNGVRVIVMNDSRLPTVNWSLTMRQGGHAEPRDRDGLGSITAALMRRGAADMTYEQLNQDLESRGITVEVADGGDFFRIGGSAMSDQIEHGLMRTRQVLMQPAFDEKEFAKLKAQTIAGLTQALSSPVSVADREAQLLIYGDGPLGRSATPASVGSISLDDVKAFYKKVANPAGALLVFSGDVTIEKAKPLAEKLLADWKGAALEPVAYPEPPKAQKRRILLIDNPEARQSVIEMGLAAYSIQSDDKFAGSLAGQILSSGIDSRLGRYVRAEKGYAYGVRGYFRPGRHGGHFTGHTETAFETTAPAIEAMFKVFNDLRSDLVSPVELREAQMRVAGSMVMDVQTIGQQAGRRVDTILNGYPIDYYDKLPQRIAQVNAEQIRDVMKKYVDDSKMAIVVVAPKEKVEEQLRKLGEVTVLPMPLKR